MDRTERKIDAPVTRAGSGHVRYELVDKDGRRYGEFLSAEMAGITARQLWPDQEQDEDRTGKGWDISVIQS